MAFTHVLHGVTAHRYGIEIEANRSEQARTLGIETLQANAMDVRCPAEAVSLLYLNPPYDWESGESNNQRLEFVFLEHSYRWLKAGGVLLFVVIPAAAIGEMRQVVERAFHRLARVPTHGAGFPRIQADRSGKGNAPQNDTPGFLMLSCWMEYATSKRWRRRPSLNLWANTAEVRYEVPASESAALTNMGIPLDEVEDLLLESAAYRQAARLLLPKLNDVRGRPLTPLHGGHVGLLCTAGMLNGVFGEGEARHIAHWRSVKFTDHWEEEEEDGTKILHDRERFSHELTLVFANGKTQVLTHEKREAR